MVIKLFRLLPKFVQSSDHATQTVSISTHLIQPALLVTLGAYTQPQGCHDHWFCNTWHKRHTDNYNITAIQAVWSMAGCVLIHITCRRPDCSHGLMKEIP